MAHCDSADALIEQLRLEPHPEGGWYRETWRGPEGEDGRAAGTAILFLLKTGERSHWHRVDASEVWIWQQGDPLALRVFEEGSDRIQTVPLGHGSEFQGIVAPHAWQAAEPDPPGERAYGFTLVSCVVMPGFDFAGFELAPPDWTPPTCA